MPPPAKATSVPTPFRPGFTDDELNGLKATLTAARASLPAATFASKTPGQNYGITTDWMENALSYWEDGFDWRKREDAINLVDHFTTTIEDGGDSFKVHFIAHYSEDPEAIPLLLLHGWPGSLLEFIDTIRILKRSTSPSFHLICPNQPGYGWSDGPPLDRGFGMSDVASICHKLMVGLGFEGGYVAQGGDIGSVIARIMASKYDTCRAININYMPLLPPSGNWNSPWTEGLTDLEITNARKAQEFAATGRGYGVMHGTRPATIGIVVQSSPVALLAWLGEKFRDWTDDDLSLDQILETCTVWWLLGTFPKSIYAYAELTTGVGAWHRDPALYLHKPFGFSSFAKEIASAPRAWAAQTGNLAFYRYHEKGGHFAALEQPEAFAKDMQDCFGPIYPRQA